jgi:murein DD-endopeptidase MepM/ murein hydrolase activator NlpD
MRASLPAALVTAVLALALPAPAAVVSPGSADVAALQTGLSALGLYSDNVDGFAGPLTLAALRKLPGASSALAAGTRTALGDFGSHPLGSRPIVAGCSGWDVAALQFLLAWHGFPPGTLDGTFGDRTTAALLRFQRWAGIDPIGIAGPQTLAALRQPPPVSPIRLALPMGTPPADPFGPRGNRFHTGIDYPAPMGTPVAAAGDGTVVSAGAVAGYGKLVVLAHGSGVTSWYGHLSRILVSPGQRVARGATVGLVGATGDATGPHLHFEVRVRDAAVDPESAL